MAITRTRFYVLLLLAATVGFGTLVTVQLVYAKSAYIDYKDDLARPIPLPMRPGAVPASWVTSGSPRFQNNLIGESEDGSSRFGTWECFGPGGFTWHYEEDETIFILEGSAEIEYLGNKFSIKAGESTHFAAGTTANWVVQDHIRKAWVLHEPGSLVRVIRRMLP